MKKNKLLLATGLCLTLCTCAIACTGTDSPETSTEATTPETNPETLPETTPETTAPAPIDKGTLSIPTVYAWVDYPDADFYPVFSMPEYAEPLTYTYDTEGISIDAEKNTVKALKAGAYTVTAKSAGFEATFKVIAEAIDRSEVGDNGKVKFSADEYAWQANNYLMQWKVKGADGQTTVFIGDSFFDTAFWSNFYNDSYPGKDALCLGISSTTTYDWEEWITDGFLSQTKPRNIVMHMGTNNVYDDGDSVADTVSSLQRMFTLMHNTFPDVPIYWFGISQRSYDQKKISAVRNINRQMQAWCDARDYITYIDTPGLLKNDMLRDNVHPKVEYYSIFVDALAETDIVIGDATMADR